MKVIVEIKDNLFLASYFVGESEHHYESPLTVELLISFAGLLNDVRGATMPKKKSADSENQD